MGREVIASTDPEVVRTQRQIDLDAGGPGPGDPPPQVRRSHKRKGPAQAKSAADTKVDLGQLSTQARAFAEAGQKAWTDLTQSDDVLARGIPYIMIVAGIALVAARFFYKRSQTEDGQ